ncbi:MAG: hypothetical protein OXI33_02105 [Chloroflexota bacterium]|nr:hypothetical protein [Chloroflexota bacterium]
MADEAQKAAKAWLLARDAEGLTQDQIAEQLSPFLSPEGVHQTTVGRMLKRCKEEEGKYPIGLTLRGITALLECEKAELEQSADDEGTGQDESVTTLPAAAQPAPPVAIEDAEDVESIFTEVPGPTPEELRAEQREKFLARQAEVDRDIKAVYKRLAAAGIVDEDSNEIYGDALIFHKYALRFKYADPGAEIVGFGPPDFKCPCGYTLESHREKVLWEQRLQEFAVPPGSERPGKIGVRSTSWATYEPCLDERWLRGEDLHKKLTRWRRLVDLTPQWWKDKQLPWSPSPYDISWFEIVLMTETDLLGPNGMMTLWMPILDWKPFVYDHEAKTMSMDDALAHQRARLRRLKRRARFNEFMANVLVVAGYAGILSIATLVATGVWVQDLWWSGAVSSPAAVLLVLVVLICLARRPWPGPGAS